METKPCNGKSLAITSFNWDYSEMIVASKMLSKDTSLHKKWLIKKNIKVESKEYIFSKN